MRFRLELSTLEILDTLHAAGRMSPLLTHLL